MSKIENGQKIGSRAFSPEDLTAAERAYYSETWGFDPVADKKVSPRHPKVLYYYEASIPLENDPELWSAGVTMHARVEVDANGKSHNRIVFMRGEKSVTVACVHTAVHIATPREILELSEEKLNELAVSAGGRQVILPPWEHCAALKSFAAGIAAVGLLWLVDQIPIPEPINGSVWAVGQDTIPEPNKWKRNSI